MESIWIVRLEVIVVIDSAPKTVKRGFINVVLSAKDAAGAESRVREVLAEYGWQILGVEDISTVDHSSVYDELISELIDDVLQHPHHVRLATLHTYKSN